LRAPAVETHELLPHVSQRQESGRDQIPVPIRPRRK
jgi:hypothetical protein